MRSKNRIARVGIVAAVVIGIIGFAFSAPPAVVAQSSGWSRPFRLSLDGTSWFPDITADASGRVHVIWSAVTLDYRMWDGRGWSSVSDIAVAADAYGLPIADVFRTGIVADSNGYLNLFYYHLTEGLGYFTRAPSERAALAQAWERPQVIGARGQGYYSALAVDKNDQLHAVYIDTSIESQLAEVFYRRSERGGVQWSPPVNLSNSPRLGSSRPQILHDQFDVLHVSWDEGWDRRSGEGAPQTSRYVFSINNGRDWSTPATFGSTRQPAVHLVVTSGQRPESRIAVWRTTTDEAVYYQTSSDSGKTWSTPAPIPGILPRLWNSPPFDQYTLARDDRGVVHLVLVTRRSQNASLWAVTHIEWDGRVWSRPETIFEQDGLYPEYPRIAIALGNQLHVVWFTRTALFTIAPMDVWHSMRTIETQAYTPVPAFPTVTPVPPTPTVRAAPTPTRFAPVRTTTGGESLPTSSSSSAMPLIVGGAGSVFAIIFALYLRHILMRRD